MTKADKSVAFAGRIGNVVHTKQPDGRIFEQYCRPPGVRLIIISPDNKILITKEDRHEVGGLDLRLPGGKVCDTMADWLKLLDSGSNVTEAAEQAARTEARQETGLTVGELELITIAHAGATVDWDLYYFVTRDYQEHPDGQDLELGENIKVSWLSAAEIQQAIKAGQMNEWRSVGVLLGLILPSLAQ